MSSACQPKNSAPAAVGDGGGGVVVLSRTPPGGFSARWGAAGAGAAVPANVEGHGGRALEVVREEGGGVGGVGVDVFVEQPRRVDGLRPAVLDGKRVVVRHRHVVDVGDVEG